MGSSKSAMEQRTSYSGEKRGWTLALPFSAAVAWDQVCERGETLDRRENREVRKEAAGWEGAGSGRHCSMGGARTILSRTCYKFVKITSTEGGC